MMTNAFDEDDVPVDEREGADFIDGLQTTADSPSGEGLSVELWSWNAQYVLKSTDGFSDWHDLGAITARQARKEMDDLFGELQDSRA